MATNPAPAENVGGAAPLTRDDIPELVRAVTVALKNDSGSTSKLLFLLKIL